MAAHTIETGWALLFTAAPCPSCSTLTFPISRVTGGIIVTVTGLTAARAIGASVTCGVAKRTNPTRWTLAVSSHGVTTTTIQTPALLLAFETMKTLRTGFFTVRSSPAWETSTGTAHMLTHCFILTLASVTAALAEESLWTLLITAWSRVACFTEALPSHRVTAAHAAPAVTLVGTVRSPASRLTSFPTVGSCPAIFTNAETGHMVAMPAVFTGAAQLAAEAKVPKWADILTEVSHVSRWTNTGAMTPITQSTIITGRT